MSPKYTLVYFAYKADENQRFCQGLILTKNYINWSFFVSSALELSNAEYGISNGPISFHCIVPNFFLIVIYHCKIYDYWHKL
jgi:hypothetical protein